ncbi:hypothetical protein [Butyrivibrio proteoclasticus]|uniref:hypothetical protein n=1 Tax=Butyrivibrio proteoclasticus TaxID=43305 RepID=UPI0002ECD6A2|nr:hypothetical protein [Butyrivibrio proteoclasticus]
MNEYQKALIKPNGYIYKGEDLESLKEILHRNAGISENHPEGLVKPPIGNIYVGNDYRDSWIWSRCGFFGWNIFKVKSLSSDKIRMR